MKAGIQACTVELERDGLQFTLLVQKVTRIRDITGRREWEGELTEAERREAVNALQLFGLGAPAPVVRSTTLRIKRGDRPVQLLIQQPPLWVYDMRTNLPWTGTLTDREQSRIVGHLEEAAT